MREPQESRTQLGDVEVKLLSRLLSVQFPGVETLRMQANHVMRQPFGLPSIVDFIFEETQPAADVLRSLPVQGNCKVNETYFELLLFVYGGQLTSMEVITTPLDGGVELSEHDITKLIPSDFSIFVYEGKNGPLRLAREGTQPFNIPVLH